MNFRGEYEAGEQNDFANDVLNADNTLDGLLINDIIPALAPALITNAIPQVMKRIQLSLVAFGLREYNRASYPTQLINPNGFKVNHIDPNNYAFYGLPPQPFYPSAWSDLAILDFFNLPS